MFCQSANTVTPVVKAKKEPTISKPNAVWLMSFLLGQVDAIDPRYRTSQHSATGYEPVVSQENTDQGSCHGGCADLSEVFSDRSRLLRVHGRPCVAGAPRQF